MKKLVLLLICILSSSVAIGAEKSRKSKGGVAVIPAQIAAINPWVPTAFANDIERLPAGYQGLDPVKFLSMYKSKTSDLKKGEFETSEEFVLRTANKDALLQPINTSDLRRIMGSGLALTHLA